MNPTTVLILEDSAFQAADMKAMLEDWGYRVLVSHNSDDALFLFQEENPDLLLLDINLEQSDSPLNGIQAGAAMMRIRLTPHIYVTAYPERYEEAKPTSPNAFFRKPYNPNDLNIAIDLAISNHLDEINPLLLPTDTISEPEPDCPTPRGHIWVRNRDGAISLPLERLLYIKADNAYVKVVAESGNNNEKAESYFFTGKIGDFEQKLQGYGNFVRAHRSYLFNTLKVTRCTAAMLWLKDIHTIPVSDTYRVGVRKALGK
jgi:DNA-binding LytR/AlgR family response regulator